MQNQASSSTCRILFHVAVGQHSCHVSLSPSAHLLALVSSHILTIFILLIIACAVCSPLATPQHLSTVPCPALGPQKADFGGMHHPANWASGLWLDLANGGTTKQLKGKEEELHGFSLVSSLLNNTLTVAAFFSPRSQHLSDNPSRTALAKFPLPLLPRFHHGKQ